MSGQKQFVVRAPEDLHARLVELAERERRSLNSQILVLLEQALDELDNDEIDAPDARPELEAARG